MKSDDLVSIIMPAYNASAYIETTIRSVICQTYQNWELLIVDDCSTDETVAVAKATGDSRVKVLSNQKNSGAAVSRNYALREASGRWIAFLDSDDLWFPQKLENQLNFMKEQNCPFCFTDYLIERDGCLDPCVYTGPDVVRLKEIYRYCYFSTITVIYDSEVVGLIQIENLKKNNDYAMWLKAAEKTNFLRMPAPLSIYRKHNGSISSGRKWRLVKYHYILFRKGQKFGRIKSVFCTARNLIWGVYKKVYYKRPLDDGVRTQVARLNEMVSIT